MRLTLALFFSILATTTSLIAQNPAGLSGIIVDPQGRPIAGAELKLYREDGRTPSTAISSDTGTYKYEDIEPGTFLLQAANTGFRTVTLAVKLPAGELKKLDITLPLAGVSERVVVTAAAQAQTPDEVSKAVTSVSRDEIVTRNTISLADTLSTTPGLTVRNQGGPGQYTSLAFRGLPSAATAILVDGMRLRDASTTQGDATALLPELNFVNLDHIEVLRGSGSALYGTQAAGGVVNIMSDTGGGPLHGDAQIEGGGLGLVRGRGSIAGGAFGDRLKYSAALLHLNVMSGVDGQDANRSSGTHDFLRYDFTSKVSLSARFLGSDDFVQVNNSPTSFGVPPTNIPSTAVVPAIPLSPAGVHTLLAGGTPDFGNATYIPDANDPDNRVSSRFEDVAFVLRDLVTPRASWQASYQLVHTRRTYENGPLGVGFQPPAFEYSNYAGTIQTANLNGSAQLSSWLSFTGGYEFEDERYDDRQDNHLPPASHILERTHLNQNSNSGFFAAQLSALNRRVQLSASGRAQSFSLSTPVFEYFGTDNPYAGVRVHPPAALTGDVSAAYLLYSTTKLRAHFGNAYRAPSLFERFGAGFFNDFLTGRPTFTPYGDPRLAPDRYNSVDGGIDQYLFGSKLRLSGTFFYTRIVQLINFSSNGMINPQTDPFDRSSGYFNGSGGISRGVEISIEAHPVPSFTLSGSYTYTNSGTDQDFQVPGFFRAYDLPRHAVTVVVTKSWNRRITTTFDYFHYSSYYDPYIGYLQAYRFPGYGRANLAGSYSFWLAGEKTARVYAKIGNLFNETYYVIGNLAPRATGLLGLAYSF